eukprot:XP_001704396.1 Hypothetical protein GL50803_37895 [Giardia lamblia ATCC 50803]
MHKRGSPGMICNMPFMGHKTVCSDHLLGEDRLNQSRVASRVLQSLFER